MARFSTILRSPRVALPSIGIALLGCAALSFGTSTEDTPHEPATTLQTPPYETTSPPKLSTSDPSPVRLSRRPLCVSEHPMQSGVWLEDLCTFQEPSGALLGDRPASNHVDVYILAGQSNMNGHGLVRDLPVELREAHVSTLLYHGSPGRWGALRPASTLRGRFGPEVSFGRAMAEDTERRVGLVKVAAHWTSLSNDWATPNGWLFRALQKTVRLALRDLRARGLKPHVRGFVWMQGETDAAMSQAAAQAYEKRLGAFLRAVRTSFGTPDLICVVGAVSGPRLRWRNIVRRGQKKSTEKDTYTFLVETEDLPLLPDALHWSSVGNVRLGLRFASVLRAERVRSARQSTE